MSYHVVHVVSISIERVASSIFDSLSMLSVVCPRCTIYAQVETPPAPAGMENVGVMNGERMENVGNMLNANCATSNNYKIIFLGIARCWCNVSTPFVAR